MRRWFNDSRRTYNLCISYFIKKNWHKKDELLALKFPAAEKLLSNMFITAAALVKRKRDYMLLRTPKVIRQQAMKEALAHLKTHKTNLLKRQFLQGKYPEARKFKKEIKFHPGFKQKKNWVSDSIGIESVSFKAIANTSWEFDLFATTNVHTRFDESKAIMKARDASGDNAFNLSAKPAKPKCYAFRNIHVKTAKDKTVESGPIDEYFFSKDKKIHYSHGQFYVLVPEERAVADLKRRESKDVDDVVAIDPGVRVFATAYSPQGQVEELGTNTTKVLKKHLKRIVRKKKKKVELETSFALNKQGKSRKQKRGIRNRLRRAKRVYMKSEEKAKNVVKNLHFNIAHHLLSKYSNVILPNSLNSGSAMKGPLARSVKQRLNMLAFGQFKSRLHQVATNYKDRTIFTGSEAYTSKQCGLCGVLNNKLGASKLFTCSCGCVMDRDVHAARNILLRFLT